MSGWNEKREGRNDGITPPENYTCGNFISSSSDTSYNLKLFDLATTVGLPAVLSGFLVLSATARFTLTSS